MCREITVASWMLEPFGEVGANFSLHLSWRTQFAKMKKLTPKINEKNIKKINLISNKCLREIILRLSGKGIGLVQPQFNSQFPARTQELNQLCSVLAGTFMLLLVQPQFPIAGPRSAVGNVSGYRCVSDCISRGREFDPGPVPYFCGD